MTEQGSFACKQLLKCSRDAWSVTRDKDVPVLQANLRTSVFRERVMPLLRAANVETGDDEDVVAYQFRLSDEIELIVQESTGGLMTVSAVFRSPIDLRDGSALALLLKANRGDDFPMVSTSIDPATQQCVIWGKLPMHEMAAGDVISLTRRVAEQALAIGAELPCRGDVPADGGSR